MQIQKLKREVDKAYLDYIKMQPCIIHDSDCIGDISPHHTKTKGSGGNDLLTVPLCAYHHHRVHFLGRKTFQQRYNVDFMCEITRLYRKYKKGGERWITCRKKI